MRIFLFRNSLKESRQSIAKSDEWFVLFWIGEDDAKLDELPRKKVQ